jgi:hypothetical protein
MLLPLGLLTPVGVARNSVKVARRVIQRGRKVLGKLLMVYLFAVSLVDLTGLLVLSPRPVTGFTALDLSGRVLPSILFGIVPLSYH